MALSLSAGSKVGPYVIRSRVGAGGMGEVWRATDPRLGREVAIKILPPHLDDPEARSRFEREARSVAGLGHPGIVAVYDVGEADGIPFLVMELLDGETVADRMLRGSLPVRAAIDATCQVARALSAAHARGVVHRDVKPGNVFWCRDGTVKVLDFGLARVVDTTHDGATAAALTVAGVVMGTVGYMAPEQVRGHEVDARADVFALGCLLWEMLGGQRAFTGNSAADVQAAVLSGDPVPLPPGRVAMTVERVARRCLEKEPESRFQDAKDVAFALEATSDASGASPPAPPGPPRRVVLAGAVALALGTVAGAAAVLANVPDPPQIAFYPLTFERGSIDAARFGPDGKTVYYSARWRGRPTEMFQVRPGVLEPLALRLPDAQLLAVDARDLLVLLRAAPVENGWSGTLARVPLTGGTPREIRDRVSWADARASAELSQGADAPEFPMGSPIRGCMRPRVASTGDRVVCIGQREGKNHADAVFAVDADGVRHPLFEDAALTDLAAAVWGPGDGSIWMSGRRPGSFGMTVWAGDVGGRARIALSVPSPGTLDDIAPDGTALLNLRTDDRTTMLGEKGGAEVDGSVLTTTMANVIEPDGSVLVTSFAEEVDLMFRVTRDGRPPVNLGEGYPLDLSADGRWVLSEGSDHVLREVPLRAGEPRRIDTAFTGRHVHAWYLPGGGYLARVRGEADVEAETRLWVLDDAGAVVRAVTPEGWTVKLQARPLAPDGSRFVAAPVADPDGARVFRVDTGESAPIPGLEPGEVLASWGADSASIFVFRRDVLPTPVTRVDLVTGARTPWVELAPRDLDGVAGLQEVLLTPDGQRYAYSFYRTLSSLYLVSGLEPASGTLLQDR